MLLVTVILTGPSKHHIHTQREDISVEKVFVLAHNCFAFEPASRWWIS